MHTFLSYTPCLFSLRFSLMFQLLRYSTLSALTVTSCELSLQSYSNTAIGIQAKPPTWVLPSFSLLYYCCFVGHGYFFHQFLTSVLYKGVLN